jgi:hypothetical protein
MPDRIINEVYETGRYDKEKNINTTRHDSLPPEKMSRKSGLRRSEEKAGTVLLPGRFLTPFPCRLLSACGTRTKDHRLKHAFWNHGPVP